ncbi:MAG: hypothetical protein C0596_10160 [Marinilabiliales bacterium]|nr:MAG: hypothetical protein C0596_10160 [Marinilabiliales bacterium]
MKNRIIILLAAVIIIPMFFISCEEELDTPPIATINPDMVLEISDIYQIYADSGEYTFTEDYMLYATVTMDDYEGNIYKEAYIQDTTGGINLYKLSYAETTKAGDYIRLNLNGVSIVDYSGKMELVFADILDISQNLVIQHSDNPIDPVPVTIEEIETGDYDCQLVEVQGLQFAASDTNKTYATFGGTSATNRNAEDCNGKEILIRTSDYADFAGDSIPSGNGSLVAIVTKYQYSGGDIVWQLLIRSIDEVEMEGERCN